MPADAVPGSTIPEDSEAEILLRDGTWVWAQVIGQRGAQMRRVLHGVGVPAVHRRLRDLHDLGGQRHQVPGEVVEVVADPVQQLGAH